MKIFYQNNKLIKPVKLNIKDIKMYYLYLLTNKINEKTYIGQTKNIKTRWGADGGRYKGCTALYRAIKKYGFENFDKEILLECETEEEINNFEVEYISKYKAEGKAEYNIAGGGYESSLKFKTEEEKQEIHRKIAIAHKGKNLSEEQKKKISESMKLIDHSWKVGKSFLTEEGRKILSDKHSGKNHWNYGNKMPEEQRQRLANLQKGNKQSKETIEKRVSHYRGINHWGIKKVICIETNEIFDTIVNAAKNKKISSCGNIVSCCKGNRKTAGGFHWKYIEENK
jgi:group I intron endonuclease